MVKFIKGVMEANGLPDECTQEVKQYSWDKISQLVQGQHLNSQEDSFFPINHRLVANLAHCLVRQRYQLPYDIYLTIPS